MRKKNTTSPRKRNKHLRPRKVVPPARKSTLGPGRACSFGPHWVDSDGTQKCEVLWHRESRGHLERKPGEGWKRDKDLAVWCPGLALDVPYLSTAQALVRTRLRRANG